MIFNQILWMKSANAFYDNFCQTIYLDFQKQLKIEMN